jgi:hypothetical protein
MANAAEVVSQYHQAFGNGECREGAIAACGRPSLQGPIEEFDNADAYMQSVARLAQIVTGSDVKKVLADGNDVVTIYDLHTSTPAGTSSIAEWATVEGGKIAEMRAFFDARPFAAMFEQ